MMIRKNTIAIIYAVLFVLIAGCTKEQEVFGEPYGEGKNPLGIKIDATKVPTPAEGLPGSTVTIAATGLVPFKDQIIFRINGEQAEVKEVTEAGITVVVPGYASSGVTSISIGDQVVFGPIYRVNGYLSVDPTFRAVNGANNFISQRFLTDDNKVIFVGAFNNYDNKGVVKPINRIVRTFNDGTYDASLRSGRGANGLLNRIVKIGDRYFVGGYFNGYDQRGDNISNITSLFLNGSVDTMGVKTFRRPTQTDTTKYFAKFNGGVTGEIVKMYEQDGKILASGSFFYYVSRQYDKSNRYQTRDTVILDSIEMRQIVRLNVDGTLDKTYRYDQATNRSPSAGNGFVNTYLHKEGALAGKLLVYGGFTKFDDVSKGYITRLNANGTIDESFNAGGVGADFRINDATYNPVTRKYLICGNFKKYNSQNISWMAMLNEDGSLDPTFVPRPLDGGGGVGEIRQLNSGLIVATGNFRTYNGITRNGFMILEPNGDLAVGYNATGVFNGWLSDVIETETEDGRPALLLIGGFNRFDNEPVNNILRLVITK